MIDSVSTANINTKWLDNIYENIKLSEGLERDTRNGFSSMLDYFSIPFDKRKIERNDLQLYALERLINELLLLMTDIIPVYRDSSGDKNRLKEIEKVLVSLNDSLKKRNVFINESFNNINKKIEDSNLTEKFYKVLETVINIRREMILGIKHVLFQEDEQH